MRNLRAIVLVSFLAAVPASAQTDYPKAEVFGGFSHLNADFPDQIGLNFGDRGALNGWAFGASYNSHGSIGVAAEVSGHYGHLGLAGLGFEIKGNAHTALFGPRFSWRGERVTLFSHALAGALRTKLENSDSDTGFALGLGGGFDVNASKGFAIRVIQVDYLPVRLNQDWRRNVRIQTGVVFRIGGH